ncbi:Toll/interleukin-1 receptor domain-containing protein [Tanacetum coccineum]
MKQFLGSLKYLNLSYSKLVTIGGFEGLPALERLILTRCESLTHVCESICECDSLVSLDLSYCSKLKNIRIIIEKLKNDKVLRLDGCEACLFDNERKRMKLLDDVSKKLQPLFSSITRLVPINSQKWVSLSLPSSLVTLFLTNNNLSSESFPLDFSSMSMLKSLFLDSNPIDSIPDCLKSLSRLEVLSVGGCSMLKSILCPSSTIKCLYADECDLLEKITLHQDMSLLEYNNQVNQFNSNEYAADRSRKNQNEFQPLSRQYLQVLRLSAATQDYRFSTTLNFMWDFHQ